MRKVLVSFSGPIIFVRFDGKSGFNREPAERSQLLVLTKRIWGGEFPIPGHCRQKDLLLRSKPRTKIVCTRNEVFSVKRIDQKISTRTELWVDLRAKCYNKKINILTKKNQYWKIEILHLRLPWEGRINFSDLFITVELKTDVHSCFFIWLVNLKEGFDCT